MKKKETYRLWDNATEQWLPGFHATDRAHALSWLDGPWLYGCPPELWVVRVTPTSFGEIIAKGGEEQ